MPAESRKAHFTLGYGGLGWSPDGRYLVYSIPTSMRTFKLVALDTSNGRKSDLTSGDFADLAPSFDPVSTTTTAPPAQFLQH